MQVYKSDTSQISRCLGGLQELPVLITNTIVAGRGYVEVTSRLGLTVSDGREYKDT